MYYIIHLMEYKFVLNYHHIRGGGILGGAVGSGTAL